ncbi:anhydro-N-acetylmuramic acid kinase [Flavobacterium psychrophilum]|uniref:anhydro-N-acetylmuramic acid kinase n=1 Tax=Flavobacterium psychrophilum TaxID=96345 RepID=UPI0029DDD673|nr:anhydro-N-acetylmuramic acid kinase [Flavobacterium psychrophilum]MEB3380076.1 anhydro-N-acetylmuramic acid kinase [Flavobacterium psychrophilum]
MIKQYYNVLGVMSGTSLDGVDLAHIIFFEENEKWSFEIKESQTVSYSEFWINQLKEAVGFCDSELAKLNSDYTILLAEIISNFIKNNKIENIDAVCSHGHTILHQPQNGFTLQIGNLPQIAKLINQNVVCDFRVQDVALGGQGAPLVPIGDQILFSAYDYCLNLGGFSNVSFNENGNRIAFDISAVNTVLNFYANTLGFDYDDKGQTARSGIVSQELLSELNELDYYHKSYPKSLGFEFVKTILLPIIENYQLSIEDKLRTFTEHVAIQIALALPIKTGSLFITGGGVYNDFLIEKIQCFLPKMTIVIPNAKTIEFKEALIFALLGVLKLRDKINVLASVTGAKKNHSSGKIYTK